MPPEVKEAHHLRFYTITLNQLLEEFNTSPEDGLSPQDAANRIKRYGKNSLPQPKKVSPMKMFLKQFANFMIYILLGATVLSAIVGDLTDAFLIGIVVIVNACIGFYQEYKAEKILASLQKIATPTAKVVRDGQIEEIASEFLVPGDIIVLEEGDLIPADLRLTESIGLHINESILTGESMPAQKDAEIKIENKVSVGDRINMAFMGTTITKGHGRGVVVATGALSQMGQIAQTLSTPYEKPTPLQKNLSQLGKYIVLSATVVSLLIFFIGLAQGREIKELLFTVVSLGVAVIPEGLAAVVTVTMAIGVGRMARKNAIVRSLPAVETLGAVNIICSDKTGTITEGKMVATDLWVGEKLYTVSGTGIDPEGSIYCDDKPVHTIHPDVKLTLQAMTFCNDAVLQLTENDTWEAVGDPTEIALQVLAHKLNVKKDQEKEWEFIEGLPFDSERKLMSVIYKKKNGDHIIFTKGAPEAILAASTHVIVDGKVHQMDGKRKQFEEIDTDMAGRGLRVLGLATRTISHPLTDIEPATIEAHMTFLGMVGVLDPARPEVKAAVSKCAMAGIDVLMVTGDHPATAENIGRQLGIFADDDKIMTGEEMDNLTEEQLTKVSPFPRIFARVSPENKLMLIQSLRRMKHVVAMTGDGVNDAAAIKHANVGVAMGKEGTDITKQAADIVLADDNFTTIVTAVEEGRRIFTNILKFVRYLLSCNASTVCAILLTTIAGAPLPFTPIQILWLNLVTDTPPALALGFDELEENAMQHKPRSLHHGIFRKADVLFILFHALVMAGIMLSIFYLEAVIRGGTIEKARTMAFAMLVLVQLTQALNAKSTGKTLFRRGTISNVWLLVGIGASFILLLCGLYVPVVQNLLGQIPLGIADWAVLAGGVGVFILLTELFKFIRRSST